jgi:hypothetical protein
MVCCQKAAPRDCPRAAILAVHGFSMLLPPLSLCDSGPDDSPRLSIGMGFFRAETHPGLLHLRLRPATGAARGLTTGRRRAGPPYGVAAASRPGTSFPGVTNRARRVRVAAAARPERQVSRLIEVRFPPQTGREKSPPRRTSPCSPGHPYPFHGGLARHAYRGPWSPSQTWRSTRFAPGRAEPAPAGTRHRRSGFQPPSWRVQRAMVNRGRRARRDNGDHPPISVIVVGRDVGFHKNPSPDTLQAKQASFSVGRDRFRNAPPL